MVIRNQDARSRGGRPGSPEKRMASVVKTKQFISTIQFSRSGDKIYFYTLYFIHHWLSKYLSIPHYKQLDQVLKYKALIEAR